MLAWIAGQTERIDVGRRRDADPGPHPGDDRDDRGDPRHAVRRPVPARAWACPARRSPRAGTASASPSRWRAPGSTSTSSSSRCRRETVALRRRALHAAAARRAGQGAQADASTRSATTSRSTWPRSGPKNLELAGEIADGWLAIFYAPEYADEQLAASPRAGPRPARTWTGSTSCPRVPVVIGDDVADVRRAGPLLRRALRRRDGQPGAELLQRARHPDGLRRRRRARSRTSTWPSSTATRPRPCRWSSSTGPAARARGADRRPAARLRRRRGDHAVVSPLRGGRRDRRRRPCARGRARRWSFRASGDVDAQWRSGRPIVLGIVEGLTEFLPISSHRASDHRREADGPARSTTRPSPAFTAVIQIGAIAAVLVYFFKDIVRLVAAWFRGLVSAAARAGVRLPVRLVRHRRLDPDRHRRPPRQGPHQGPPAQPVGGRRRADPVERA